MTDPYAELGVSRSATAEEIRRAYRRLAKDLHPDTRPDDKDAEERFKRVTAAFNLLSDTKQRGRYDRGEIDGDGNERAGGYAPQGARGEDVFGGGFTDFGDLFSGVFGNERGPFRGRGEDVRYRLAVSFAEAANGGRKRVVMGDGRALDLQIPEGVKTGQTLRLRGQGRGGRNGAPPGDALVEIEVEAHPYFRRDGDDIRLDLPVTLQEAVAGGRVKVPTLTGPVTVTVPKGSNTGTVLRLRGRGVRGEKGTRGDQLVRLQVLLPERADAELQRFVESWRAPRDYSPRKHLDV